MHSCPNCREEIPNDSVFCNKCGSKITSECFNDVIAINEIAVSTASGNFTEPKRKSKSKFIVSLLVLILVVGSGGGYWYYDQQNKKEESRIAAALAAENKYQQDLSTAALKVMGFSIISEEVCDSYSDVWSRSIEADYSIEVNGKRAYDFNEAIIYQREAFEQHNILSAIEKNTEEVDDLMQGLNSPVEKYKKAYDVLVELYGLYTQYADQANSPTGSLLEFNKKTNELSAEISKEFNQFKILLPNLDESKIKDYTDAVSI